MSKVYCSECKWIRGDSRDEALCSNPSYIDEKENDWYDRRILYADCRWYNKNGNCSGYEKREA